MLTTFFTSCLLATLLLGGSKPKEPAAAKAHRPDPGELVQVTYPVADLVIPISQDIGEDRETSAKTAPGALAITGDTVRAEVCKDGQPRNTTQDVLIGLIRTTVAPASWSETGGPGTLQYYPLGLGLVVYNTREIQEQVADLLAALRRLQDVEVAVEIRLVRVSEAVSARFIKPSATASADTDAARARPSKQQEMTFLNDQQVRQFLEVVQGDVRASTMQAPRFTVFNGQKARMALTRKQFFVTALQVVHEGDQVVVLPRNEAFETGFRYTARPVVSADRRTVLMNIEASLTELETQAVPLVPVTTHLACKDKDGQEQVAAVRQFVQQPSFQTMKINKSFQVGDGQTAVLHWGTRLEETQTEVDTPVLSNIPYLNRLYRNVAYGRETRHVLLLITPRIIINQELAEKLSGSSAPVLKP